MIKHGSVSIQWLGHDGFLLEAAGLRVCIDPFKTSLQGRADLILITHEHFDHLSPDDLRRLADERTRIVCPPQCLGQLGGMGIPVPMRPGEERTIDGAHIRALPAYNTNKYRDPGSKTVFHPKEDGKLGYLLTLDGTTIYHAGDTDQIPEMAGLEPDVALLPVSGTYVMTADEAARAAEAIRPRLAIPMHYGSIVGSEADAQRFGQLLRSVGLAVQILQKE